MSNVKERLDKVKEMIQEQDFLEGKGLPINTSCLLP